MPQRKVRVMHIVLEMDVGGLQRIVNLLIRNTDPSRFETHLCALDRGGMFFEQTASFCASADILGRKPGLFDFAMFLRLFRLLRKHRIDVIHSHNGCSSYAVLAGRLAGVKGIIHTDHGRLVPDRKGAIIEDRISSYLMDYFVGVSAELTAYIGSALKVRKDKLLTVVNGVDRQAYQALTQAERRAMREALSLSAGDKVIGTICRLDPIKNIPFMVGNMPELLARIPEAKLVIVGDGPSRDLLAEEVAALGIESKVVFLGLRQDTEKILPLFDLYACTSLSEGTSMTILEAMACGIPVVASDVGGNRRLVGEKGGLLYAPGDNTQYLNIVESLLADQELRSRVLEGSVERVDACFGVGLMVRQYQDLYSKLA